MRIGDICKRPVVHCTRDTRVTEIAKLMQRHHVGDVVVVDVRSGGLVPVGIVTDRDLVIDVLAQNVVADALTANDLIKGELVTAMQGEVVHDAIWYMRGRGVRRLPVVDERGYLVGILTADDVSRFLATELSDFAQLPSHQIRRETAVAASASV